MGGKEGSRGYVYQGIVAVLESFSLSFWDKIYVEFPTDDDKVDIALLFGNNIVRAIQVKSTNNTFTPQQIKQWIRDLTNDYPCPNYEFVLIGQCSGTARTFINSIEKYRINQMDKKSIEALAGFDTTIFDHAAISVRSLSDDLFSLQAHMRDSLSKYLEGERLLLSYTGRLPTQVRGLPRAAPEAGGVGGQDDGLSRGVQVRQRPDPQAGNDEIICPIRAEFKRLCPAWAQPYP